MRNTEEIWTHVDRKSPEYVALSDRVWETPELAYGEHRSAAAHLEQLEREGFRITKDVAGGRAGRRGPWLRPQHAGLGGDAGSQRGEGLAGRKGRARPGPLLRLPGGRGRRGQGLHGPRGRVQGR